VENEGAEYVRKTLLKNLAEMKVKLPDENGQSHEVSMAELGIRFPVLVDPKRIELRSLEEKEGPPPIHVTGTSTGRVRRFDFTVQFCWQPPTTAKPGDEGQMAAGF
jgi:hypothetical protein